MPSASLSDFPAELLIQVYKSLDNVKDITALNLVSHQFYDLWFSHTLSISDAVFSRTIKCFDLARELVELQEKIIERIRCNDNGHHDPYRRALEHNKLMMSNAHGFPYSYEAEAQVHPAVFRFHRDYEELQLKIYYGLCILVLAEEDTFAQSSCLASLDFETMRLMYFVIYRETYDAPVGFTGVQYVHFRFGLDKTGGKSPEDSLEYVRKILVERGRALERAEEVGRGVENV